nr:NAD(P)H-dependent oxidoreductase [Gammaproteobacteria bacterium]
MRKISGAKVQFPILRSAEDFLGGEPPPDVRSAQECMRWAGPLFIIYPLWLRTVPALLKAALEQSPRPGFAVVSEDRRWPKKLLTGRTAHIAIS